METKMNKKPTWHATEVPPEPQSHQCKFWDLKIIFSAVKESLNVLEIMQQDIIKIVAFVSTEVNVGENDIHNPARRQSFFLEGVSSNNHSACYCLVKEQ